MALSLSNLVYFVVCLSCGILGLATEAYLYMFAGDYYNLIPVTVDQSAAWHSPPRIEAYPLINNLLLLSLFMLQHSVMPRNAVKKALGHFFADDYYQPLYVVMSSVTFLLMFYFWMPMPTVLWEVTHPQISYGIHGLFVLSVLLLAVASVNLDADLWGIRAPLQKIFEWEEKPPKLIDSGLYRIMMHPIYTSSILILWIAPRMTVGHFLLSMAITVYTVVAAVYFEEPNLVKKMGQDYVKYRERTPRFIPMPWLARSTPKKE